MLPSALPSYLVLLRTKYFHHYPILKNPQPLFLPLLWLTKFHIHTKQQSKLHFSSLLFNLRGPVSSVGIATRHGLDGPGIEWRWVGGWGARFSAPVHTVPGAHPASCTVGTGSFLGVKRQGRGVGHSPPSSTEVKERVELCLYSPSGPSWPVIGRTFYCLTLILLTCRIWWAPNNAGRWQMGFNWAFKGLIYVIFNNPGYWTRLMTHNELKINRFVKPVGVFDCSK